MKRALIIAAAILSLSAENSFAVGFNTGAGTSTTIPNPGPIVMTPRGSVAMTGHVGRMMTTTLPGGGQGILMQNGNGTSTLIGSNGTSTVVATPR